LPEETGKLSLADFVYSVTTGPAWRRRLLTPVALAIVTGVLLLVIFGSRLTDRALGLPRLLPGGLGIAIGAPLLAAGLALHAWCVVLFKKAPGGGGIGVPANPPRELVVVGPYAWMRNPMVTAFFVWLSGLGLMLHSTSMVFVWTPTFLAVMVVELKLVEEPELERRLGAPYREYKGRVPMFVPKKPGSDEAERRPRLR
jgi:protein-S-isoprenylcysteine O-methyltransferase Ste14